MEVTRSVAAPKPFWNSELQGGAFNQGFTYGPEVPAGLQQCWTWSAVARGAQGILYWCWRDEVWGVESGGYGIIGQDGHAEDRIRALQQTGALLRRHTRQLEQYTPDPAGVGVVFNSNDVLLAALNRERVSEAASLSTEGTLLALERRRIPFELLDGRALEIPESVRLLILPAAFCLEPESARTILDFMEKGGWVFSEAGTGMFTPGGFYHDRSDERPLTGHLGIRQMYRRGGHLNAHCMIPSDIFGTHPEIELRSAIWTIGLECPSAGHVIARDTANTPVLIRVPHGEGRLVMSGSFPAHAYARNPYSGYEGLLHQLAHAAGAVSSWRITSDTSLTDVFVRTGRAGAQRLFFIINMGDARTFRVFPAEKGARHADEWISGQTLEISGQGGFEVNVPATHHAVLAW
jgi:beta-galactosidase